MKYTVQGVDYDYGQDVADSGAFKWEVRDETGNVRAESLNRPMAEFYSRMLHAADQIDKSLIDSAALQKIANLLDGVEWNSGMLDTIASICEEAGYQVRDIQDMG